MLKESGAAMPRRILPSEFMRDLRPEYHSDTEDHASYVLDAATLDHHLDTITSRNQTHDFELFTRKLCERAICPNLRPQTGPEGAGDSKADTETFPVADEISRIYIGEPNGGRERWAFAFSAKKKWAEKVRGDVKGIVETGRSLSVGANVLEVAIPTKKSTWPSSSIYRAKARTTTPCW